MDYWRLDRLNAALFWTGFVALTLAKMLFELSAQILSRLTIALRARSPDSTLPDVIARSNATKQSRKFSMDFMDCFAYYRIIRVVAGVTSGSNLRAGALRATAPYRKSDLAMTGNAKRYSVVPQALTWVM